MPGRHHRPWMLYGAYGLTGRLILAEALRRGHRPVLTGRDAERLRALAAAHGLACRVASLDEPGELAASLDGVDLVLNAAGPFSETGPPLIEACLQAGTCYVDISGEFHHIAALAGYDECARSAGIAILTGAGFGVTFGEGLALYALEQVPNAVRLRLSVAAANAQTTATVRRTIIEVLAKGGYAVEHGRMRHRALAHQSWVIADGLTSHPFAAAPLGELAALFRSTNVKEIVVGRPLRPGAARVLRVLSPFLQFALSIPAIRRLASRDRTPRQTGNPPAESGLRSWVWAEVWSDAGELHLFRLDTGEGYAATASAALANAEALLERSDLRGSLTPGAAFGPAVLGGIPDTTIAAPA